MWLLVNNVPSRRKVMDDVWWDYYVFITVITKCLMVEFIWNIYFDKNGKKINIHKKTPVNDRHIYKHITASTIRMHYYLVTFELWISFPPLWQKFFPYFIGHVHLIISIECVIISSNLTIDRAIYCRCCSPINWEACVKYSDTMAKYESQSITLIFSFGNVACLNLRHFKVATVPQSQKSCDFSTNAHL
jgi:hypothetical protein